jgi:HPt (histidine-containing phosphotransfer) domain-containing protein
MNDNQKSMLDIIDQETVDEVLEIMGDRFSTMVENFILDTKAILSTMNIDRAVGEYKTIAEGAHSLRSSSHQVGAKLVSLQAGEIETYIRKNMNDENSILFEKQVETMIFDLQNNFFEYQVQIKHYL